MSLSLSLSLSHSFTPPSIFSNLPLQSGRNRIKSKRISFLVFDRGERVCVCGCFLCLFVCEQHIYERIV